MRPSGGRGAHRFIGHTADVIIEARGRDLAECCAAAIDGLLGTCLDGDRATITGVHRAAIAADTPEDILLAALDETIFVLDTSQEPPVRATVTCDDSAGLVIDFHLGDPETVEPTGSVPKAIARSELAVTIDENGVSCRFLADV